MRTYLIRGVVTAVVALMLAAPAFAQTMVRGSVKDAQGKPLANATITFEGIGNGRKIETKTDGKGEFQQIGLPQGDYNVTAAAGTLKQTLKTTVRERGVPPMNFQLTATSGVSEEEKKAQAALASTAQEGVAAMNAGNFDTAIAKFQEISTKLPTCADCFYNLGIAYSKKGQMNEAEGAFKKSIELNPNNAEAYSGLANVYNQQKKFDQAIAMSQKATELSAGAGGAAGGGNAESLYNQGVTLWNAQKYAEAKTQFEAAVKLDPKYAPAWYQLGMANVNLGQLPAAKEAFQNYLKADPNGSKAAEVNGILKQLP
jgi:Flp pilus assembly protein TadD